jgi:lipooligosaccharide transport system permease protein
MAVTAVRFFESRALVYRRTWRGNVVTTFLNPVMYLAAMGLGLGALVDGGTGREAVEGLAYLTFLAPGLLAATTMQTGAGDGAWPVMSGIKWQRTYEAALATPVAIRDLVVGHLMWVTVRLTFTALVFVTVMALFGAVSLGSGLLAAAPAVLTGLAFAAPVTAYTATLKDVQGMVSLFRFGIVPMFLFSGTFFPISQLPGWIRPLAHATPLWHGVELTRGAALGIGTTWSPWISVAYLLVLAVAGGLLAVVTLGKRMRP